MKKTIIVLAVALAVLVGGFYALNAYIYNEKQAEYEPTALASYFMDRMIALGVEDIGQPIEGFDAQLLTMAFPGLAPDDFNGVEALGGHYEVRDGEAVFVSDGEQPFTSADGMITNEGYEQLLERLSVRLSHPTMDESDVDTLIERINTGERIETKLDQGASALGVKVVPRQVLEDSRCPIDVECIQAGTVRVLAMLESGLGTAPNQEFRLNETITTEAEAVTLIEVRPVAESTKTIAAEDYIFIFSIEKR